MARVKVDDLIGPNNVRAVIGNRDPVTRNLQITQTYHELTLALDELLGTGDAAWTAFATWASKQAGRFVRNEEVPAPLRRFLGLDTRRPRRRFSPAAFLRSGPFLSYVRVTVESTSGHVAAGNQMVYARLAPIFADFVVLAKSHRESDPGRFQDFLATLDSEPGTGDALRRAFSQYYKAMFERDEKLRAQRIFAANALVGWHEQMRLQESIDGALAAPIRRALDDPERRWGRLPLPLVTRKVGAFAFRTAFAPVIRSFEDDWKRVATECLLTLALPEGELELGDDVPRLADGTAYPPALLELTLAEAREVVAELDPNPGTLRGSGARDWSVVGERMSYVVDLFRSRQRERNLLEAPYTPAQVEEIYDGHVPVGRL